MGLTSEFNNKGKKLFSNICLISPRIKDKETEPHKIY